MAGNSTTVATHNVRSAQTRPYGNFRANNYFNTQGQPVWQTNPVKTSEKKSTPTTANQNDAYDKMVAAIKKEPNWFKKAGIYFRFCRDVNSANPQALEYANKIAGI